MWRIVWCSEPKRGKSEVRRRRRHVEHLFFPVPPSVGSGGSKNPPSTPKTSIGPTMRLADPTIPSSLREGRPPVVSLPRTVGRVRSRGAARFCPFAVQTILEFFTSHHKVAGPGFNAPTQKCTHAPDHNRLPRRAESRTKNL